MDIDILKRQIGENILNSLDSFYVVKNKSTGGKNVAILKKGGRTAKIILNSMDLYNITTIDGQNNFDVKGNIYADNLRGIINSFFNFSLKQALDNGDAERVEEIEAKIKDGETVRLV